MSQNSNRFTYKDLTTTFLNESPEFRQAAEMDDSWQDSDGPLVGVFFARMLKEFFERELFERQKPDLVKRLFAFMERMALSKDEGIRGVLNTEILEYFGDDKELLIRARALMLPKTLSLSHKVEKSWGRE